MKASTIGIIILFIAIVYLLLTNCNKQDNFYIEPNMIEGGYTSGPAPFELNNYADPGTDGY